jgi:hypothetical protein
MACPKKQGEALDLQGAQLKTCKIEVDPKPSVPTMIRKIIVRAVGVPLAAAGAYWVTNDPAAQEFLMGIVPWLKQTVLPWLHAAASAASR